MGTHDGFYSAVNRRLKRYQFHPVEFLEGTVDHRKSPVRVDSRIAVAGKVFGHRDDTAITETPDHLNAQCRYTDRILPERTDPNDRIGGITIYVKCRGQVNIDAECRELKGGGLTALVGVVVSPGRSQGHVSRKNRDPFD